MQIITFDFHNTLVRCDRWFDLEVRSLPWDVMLELDVPGCNRPARVDVIAAYRELRDRVVHSGNEVDSYTSVAEIFTMFGIPATRTELRSSVDRLMANALKTATLEPGAARLVRELRQRGPRLAVISSAVHHNFLESALKQFAIAPVFEQVVTSSSSGYYKSNPEIYRSTIARLGGGPSSSVHIGDSLRWDVGSAREAGIKTVWLDHQVPREPWSDAPPPAPDLRLESLCGACEPIMYLLGPAT